MLEPKTSIPVVLAMTAALWAIGCAHAPSEDLLLTPPDPPPGSRGMLPVAAGGDSAAPAASFADIAARVLDGHPDLESARRRVLAADAARIRTGAWSNPELLAEVEGWGLDRDGFEDAEVTIAAAFPLDLVGKRGTRVATAVAEREAARARYQDVKRKLLERVRLTVHSVRAARERLRLAGERLRITEETAAAIAREVDAGKAAPLEQIRAEVDRDGASLRHSEAEADLRAARLALGALQGFPRLEADVRGDLRDLAVAVPPGLRDADLTFHPRITALAWEAEAAHRRQKEISRSRWPGLAAMFGYRRYLDEDRSAWVTGIGLEIPLWDRKSGALREARELAAAADADLEADRRDLAMELEGLLVRLESSGHRLARYRDRVLPQARDALELARLGFEGGKFGYLELLDAQRALLEVETGHADALIQYDETLGRIESLLDRQPDLDPAPETP